jgi:hypothetical protein
MATGAEPTMAQEALKLLPIVTGAILAIAGGGITQYFVHRWGQSREREKLLREKAESLIRALYSHREWITWKSTIMVFRGQDHDIPSPLQEAWTIQSIYFPQLRDALLEVEVKSLPILNLVSVEQRKQREDPKTWIEIHNDETFLPLYTAYSTAVGAAVNKVASLVPKIAQG